MLNGMYDQEVLPHFDMREDIVTNSTDNRGHSQQLFITRWKKEVREETKDIKEIKGDNQRAVVQHVENNHRKGNRDCSVDMSFNCHSQ